MNKELEKQWKKIMNESRRGDTIFLDESRKICYNLTKKNEELNKK